MLKKILTLVVVFGVMTLPAFTSEEPGTGPGGTLKPNESLSIDVVSTESGKISLSIDGIGTNDASGIVQVEKPAGATVRKAFFAAASSGGHDILNGDVQINGTPINWIYDIWNNAGGSNNFFNSVFADVTSLLKPIIDAALAGRINFTITETNSSYIDGEILAVIFDDPNQSTQNSAIILFGGQNTNGDVFHIGLADTIDVSDPNSKIDLSLGISYGYQGTDQYSQIDVNGQRLTTSAGGQDDAAPNYQSGVNGALLTVGGLDDSLDNPPDPYALPNGDPHMDDELYNLKPFMKTGDLHITVNTINPSDDDNIFFAALFATVKAIIGEGILLSPATATNFVGQQHILTATVQNDSGVPLPDRIVTFTVFTGPHSGQTGQDNTDNNGKATFTYTGTSPGTDSIKACFIDSKGITSCDRVEKIWVSIPEDTTTAYVPEDTCAYQNQFICIPVYLKKLPSWDVYSAQMVLLYDENVLHATDANTMGTISEVWGAPTYNIGNGQIEIAMAGFTPLDTAGVLVWVCFNLLGGVGDTTVLEFKDDHIRLNETNFKAEKGVVRVCAKEYEIDGKVRYCFNDEVIENVQMMISGDKNDTVYTNAEGNYRFTHLPGGLDYLVSGEKENDSRGAITAFDASLALRNAVDLVNLTPCQKIAGDVTGNCYVGAYDASYILRYVVGQITEFPVEEDWKFIPADFSLNDSNWCFAQDTKSYNDLAGSFYYEDWKGILYGDISGNWSNPPLLAKGYPEDVLLKLMVKEIKVVPGEKFVVPIEVKGLSEVYAAELNLTYDKSLLSLVKVESGELLQGYYLEKKISENQIKLAMAGTKPMPESGDLVYFTFKVLPEARPGISTQLEVSHFCLNEISGSGSAFTISIGSGETHPSEFSLFQNYPNPFNPTTEISYSLPEACQVKLSIYNLLGQKVRVLADEYQSAGSKSVEWNGKDDRGIEVAAGIYFYRIEAGNFSQTKKMLLVK